MVVGRRQGEGDPIVPDRGCRAGAGAPIQTGACTAAVKMGLMGVGGSTGQGGEGAWSTQRASPPEVLRESVTFSFHWRRHRWACLPVNPTLYGSTCRAVAVRTAATAPIGLAEARRCSSAARVRDDVGGWSDGVSLASDRAATQKALGGERREGGQPCRSSWTGDATVTGRTRSRGATCSASNVLHCRSVEVDDIIFFRLLQAGAVQSVSQSGFYL